MSAGVVERLAREKQCFMKKLAGGRQAQAETFAEIVARNADTDFGRAHGFATVHSHAEYCRAVPIRDYAGLQPWLTRAIAGEPNVLTVAPVKMCLGTTGSTGEPKIFPIVQAYLSAQARNTAVFWAGIVETFPAAIERDDALVALHLVPRAFADFTSTGAPVHRLSNMPLGVGGVLPFTRAPWYPPPLEVDYKDLVYWLLRSSVEHPLAGFICQHSSRLTGLVYVLQRRGAELIEEVRAGTRLGRPHRAPNPSRADELAALLREGPLVPRRIWPQLRFTTAWLGGSYALVRDELDAAFGVPNFPYPCVSTEAGNVTVPLDASIDGPLTIHDNYYEFRVPGAPDESPTMTYEDLEVGSTYEMIFSSKSGLYRYSCGDLFRVVGTFEGVPRVEFVARAGAVNLTGEKLSEAQARAALAHVIDTLGLSVSAVTICGTWASPPHYTGVFEVRASWDDATLERVAAALDDYLRAHNSRYAWKRDWEELGRMRVRTVRPGTFARFAEEMVRRGQPLPSMKDRPLYDSLGALALFEEINRTPI